jgi:copper homeostasis protein
MRHHNPALVGLENDWVQSDTAQVSALRRALDQMG